MTKEELCKMCAEHSIDEDCECADKCKLLQLLNENYNLKAKNNILENQIRALKLEMSYMKFPNTLGDRHEMGS